MQKNLVTAAEFFWKFSGCTVQVVSYKFLSKCNLQKDMRCAAINKQYTGLSKTRNIHSFVLGIWSEAL